jgi:hypothetical protein
MKPLILAVWFYLLLFSCKDSRKISQIFLEDGREDPQEIKRSTEDP